MKQMFSHHPWLRYLPSAVLTVLGAAAVYLYYYFIGCATGTCIITSNPVTSVIYGTVLGFLIGMLVMPDKTKQNKEENHG